MEHWTEVYKNGLILGRQDFAEPKVITAFAFLHDCMRTHDGPCEDHGPLAAEFINTFKPDDLGLNPSQWEVLKMACRDHTIGIVSNHPTIGACWDADRLDIMRCGMLPIPDLMSTPIGIILANKITKYGIRR